MERKKCREGLVSCMTVCVHGERKNGERKGVPPMIGQRYQHHLFEVWMHLHCEKGRGMIRFCAIVRPEMYEKYAMGEKRRRL
jgi:hypothetical protein